MEQQVLQDLIHLTGYTDADAQTLSNVSATTQQWKEEVTQAFYDMLYDYSSTAKVFRDGERPAGPQSCGKPRSYCGHSPCTTKPRPAPRLHCALPLSAPPVAQKPDDHDSAST